MDTLSTTERTTAAENEPEMKSFGRARLADYCGDMVIYRSLKPLDPRMPNVRVALREVGLPSSAKPRKQEAEYARIALWYADAAQALTGHGESLEEIIFVGDTLFNDGRAFQAMMQVRSWASSSVTVALLGVSMPSRS